MRTFGVANKIVTFKTLAIMKQFNVIREIEIFNQSATSAADIHKTIENGTVKSFENRDDARSYLNRLFMRAFQNKQFEKVTKVGKDRIICHRKDETTFIFFIRVSNR